MKINKLSPLLFSLLAFFLLCSPSYAVEESSPPKSQITHKRIHPRSHKQQIDTVLVKSTEEEIQNQKEIFYNYIHYNEEKSKLLEENLNSLIKNTHTQNLSKDFYEQAKNIQTLFQENKEKILSLENNLQDFIIKLDKENLSSRIQKQEDIFHLFLDQNEASILELTKKLDAVEETLNKSKADFAREIDSITKLHKGIADRMGNLENEFKTRKNISTQINAISDNVGVEYDTIEMIYLIVPALSILLLFCTISLFFYTIRKVTAHQNSIINLTSKTDSLSEDVIKNFISFVDQLEKESKGVLTLISENSNSSNIEEQHSIVKAIADKLIFMEVTMTRMDPSVRGYKQLSKSISQIKENLKNNGYELIEMLGKPYNSGMKVTANFIDDEEMPQGEQKITNIIKPQINYKGKMIQSAVITVTQNV